MEAAILEELKREAMKLMPSSGTHGLDHTLRVYRTCLTIGASMGADLSILLPAALLHDIARDEEDHEHASSSKAREILKTYNYPQGKIEAVEQAIATHSFTGKLTPNTLEGKILSDADKLDAIGSIGIYRAAAYSRERGRTIDDFMAHFHEKLLTLKDVMYTKEAKSLAESRHRFMLEFLEQLSKEREKNS